MGLLRWAACVLMAVLPGLGQAAATREADPVVELGRWIESFQRRGRPSNEGEERALEALIGDLRLARLRTPERAGAIALALLELCHLEARRARSSKDAPMLEAAAARARGRGRQALGDLLVDPELARELAAWVLAMPRSHPPERRVALLELVAGRRQPTMLLGILEAAGAKEPEVRAAAWAALVGWADEGVHCFFLSRMTLAGSLDPALTWLQIKSHFRGAGVLAAEGAASSALRRLVTAGLLSTKWRETVRALELIPALPDAAVFPELIESLAVWLGRSQRSRGSRRIEGALLEELRRRSGIRIGAHPDRWTVWWRSRGSKGTDGEPPPPELPADLTQSGFFGLRPMTDRVAFVVDRSGSMGGSFGFGGRSRYDEALVQMEQLLRQLGPETRFRVILFESGLDVWSSTLKPATEANVAAARAWAAARGPGGGTVLRPAIEEVLRLGRDGLPDLGKLEEDTVIVLCDGATQEGPAWVRPVLERANTSACLMFHGVQIGGGGDGTLRRLAELSGGDFVIVSP